MRRYEPKQMVASASSETWLTEIGMPFMRAPSPRAASYLSPSAGAVATATSVRPPNRRAMRLPKTPIPAAKLLVPSMGSSTHIGALRSPTIPSSSPRIAWSGNTSAMRLRSIVSISRSAAVTIVPSALSDTSGACWKYRREISSAMSARSRANSSSFRSTSLQRRCYQVPC